MKFFITVDNSTRLSFCKIKIWAGFSLALRPPFHSSKQLIYPVRNNTPPLLAPLDAKLSNGVNAGYRLGNSRGDLNTLRELPNGIYFLLPIIFPPRLSILLAMARSEN